MANKAEQYAERKLEERGLNLYNLAEKAHKRGYRSFTGAEAKVLVNPFLFRRLRGLQREYSEFLGSFTAAMVKAATKIG